MDILGLVQRFQRRF